jgi:hypothetical protein
MARCGRVVGLQWTVEVRAEAKRGSTKRPKKVDPGKVDKMRGGREGERERKKMPFVAKKKVLLPPSGPCPGGVP